MRPVLLAIALGLTACLTALRAAPPGVGETLPEWSATGWIHSEPLALSDLRGQVVLVRFWTAPGCPYCRNSAPALARFSRKFGADGLVVVGLYHHKAPSPLDPAAVARWSKEYGFEFPVAIDGEWKTLRRWWLDREDNPDAAFTSVSFLVGRDGVVRHIHPGGQYVRGDAAHAALEKAIGEALAEDASSSAGGASGTAAPAGGSSRPPRS